ncbi:MAG: alpha-amylase family glycosyl hydrolase, partial [Betaproteobacteria bacterium]
DDLYAGERLWDQVGGDQAQYRLAAAGYLLLPGTPFIYYGEEVGMSAGLGLSGDGKLRTPMSWSQDTRTAGFSTVTPFRAVSANVASQNVASELNDPNSLLSFYKEMLRLRNTLPSIARGSYEASFTRGGVMGFQRAFGAERTLVLINYATSRAQVQVDALAAAAKLTPAYPSGSSAVAADAKGSVTLALPAQSVRVLVLGS